jgi:DNA repair exonuclease SbcCD nuclease subunit
MSTSILTPQTKFYSYDITSPTFLCIGDPHFKCDNLYILDEYIQITTQIAVDQRVDFVVIMGDVLHTHEKVSTLACNYAYKWIESLRKVKPVFVIVGNHDMVNNKQFMTSDHWMNAMKEWPNVSVVDNGAVLDFPSGRVILTPYSCPGQFKQMLHAISDDWASASLIMCHQEFRGAQIGAIQSTIGDTWEDNNPFVVSGHIHQRQILGSNVLYCGSSIQHSFTETPCKSVECVTLESGCGIAHRPVDLVGLPRKIIVYTNSLDHVNMSQYSERDKLRIVVKDVLDAATLRNSSVYKQLKKKGVQIMFKPKELNNCALQQQQEQQVVRSFESVLYDEFEKFKPYRLNMLYDELKSSNI